MRLLLDTYIFLWTLDDSPRLSRQALTEPLTLLTRDAALAPYGRNVSVV